MPQARALGKDALHDPALGHEYEAVDTGWVAFQLVGKAELGQVPGKTYAVALVGHDRDKPLAPPRPRGQQWHGFGPVVAVGRVHPAGQDSTLQAAYNLAFASVGALACVQSPVFENTGR